MGLVVMVMVEPVVGGEGRGRQFVRALGKKLAKTRLMGLGL